uniref:Protein ABIL5 n=1 Tax=Chenopodium quinoa TaxID=63459 RepID=A0A803L6E1_CHEQI
MEFGIHANGNRGAVSDDSLRFLKSLKELKELRAQIHTAADYSEKSYKNSEDKAIVLENTKEYLCRAVVTVVDHLGSVSASLDGCIQKSDRANETERRINCLKQPTNIKGVLSEPEFKTIEEMPLFMYTSFNKIRLGTSPRSPLDITPKEITVMPVREGFSVAPKLIRNPSFHFQDNRKPGGIRRLLLSIQRKSVNDEEVISVPRRSKRGASRLLRLKL